MARPVNYHFVMLPDEKNKKDLQTHLPDYQIMSIITFADVKKLLRGETVSKLYEIGDKKIGIDFKVGKNG